VQFSGCIDIAVVMTIAAEDAVGDGSDALSRFWSRAVAPQKGEFAATAAAPRNG